MTNPTDTPTIHPTKAARSTKAGRAVGRPGAPRSNTSAVKHGLRSGRDVSAENWGRAKCPKCGTSIAGTVGSILRGAWNRAWKAHRRSIRRETTELLKARGLERDYESKAAGRELVKAQGLSDRLHYELVTKGLRIDGHLREEARTALDAGKVVVTAVGRILDRAEALKPASVSDRDAVRQIVFPGNQESQRAALWSEMSAAEQLAADWTGLEATPLPGDEHPGEAGHMRANEKPTPATGKPQTQESSE